MNAKYLTDMERLERLANELKLQRYTKLEGNSPLQADYIKAIEETLNAYNRLANKIGVEDA